MVEMNKTANIIQSFFETEDMLSGDLSYASKIDEEISMLESELRLVDSEASNLLKAQEEVIPESFMTFMRIEVAPNLGQVAVMV